VNIKTSTQRMTFPSLSHSLLSLGHTKDIKFLTDNDIVFLSNFPSEGCWIFCGIASVRFGPIRKLRLERASALVKDSFSELLSIGFSSES
jgi:hypothetical protein